MSIPITRTALALATLAALGLAASQPAAAQINGFGTGAGFTLNHGGDATHGGDGGDGGNPASFPTSGTLQLTDSNNSEANSVIYNTKQNITAWNAAFTYTETSGAGGANGFTFFLENAPNGTAALGGRGDGMGYGSDDSGGRASSANPNYIANSAAIAFNIYTSGGRTAGTEFLTAGATGTTVNSGTFVSTNPVNLQSGDPILVNLSYNGTTLFETLTDTTTSAVYNTSYATNLASVVGANTAYVGFGGGTGGFNVNQTISGFTFAPAPEPGETAALGLGVLGLAGLAFKARRRRSVA